MIIRPIAHKDLPALQQMAVESGPGFTSLVNDERLLADKIQRSMDSFQRSVSHPGDETYLFVLEDTDTGEIMGISGIEASVGVERPLYHFHRSQVMPMRRHDGSSVAGSETAGMLEITSHYRGCTEICTLFLRPQFRRPWAGKLLSRVRFAFMAQHPERFAAKVIAEMRGVSDADGQAPFWNWLRPHFVDLDFATVTQRMGAGDSDFITRHKPGRPLPGSLLSPEALAVIGQVHENTRPALSLLEAEGFRYRGFFDLFDGGPTVEAERHRIRSIASSGEHSVRIMARTRTGLKAAPAADLRRQLLITNVATGQFRARVTGEAEVHPDTGHLVLPSAIAESLGLSNGDRARVIDLAASQSMGLGRPGEAGRQTGT